MINLKSLIINILIPIAIGFLGSLLGGTQDLQGFTSPSFVPPPFIFPIVWTLLYILMGIGSYLVYESKSEYTKRALTFYGIQLFLNSIWTLFFFRLNWFLFSFWLIIIIIALSLIMIFYFYKIKKIAGYLQISYILWLTFASIITYSTYLLNV